VTAKETLNKIRGWLPKESLNPNKQMQIKLEINPLKLRQRMGKSTINVAQFVAVLLAVGLILGGLYLNSISKTQTSQQLPIEWTTLDTPFQYNGTNYNCSINLFVSPPLMGMMGSDIANMAAPIYVYINEPSNLTSGVYFTTLRYVRYNATLNAYTLQQTNDTSTFSPTQTIKQDLIISAIYLKPPFEPGPGYQEPIVRDVVFTLYCNTTGKLHSPLFTISTPINLAQSGFIVTYPYRNIGNLLLSLGIISLIIVLAISFVNLRKNSDNFPVKENPVTKAENTLQIKSRYMPGDNKTHPSKLAYNIFTEFIFELKI
jgi:hypothetical protein